MNLILLRGKMPAFTVLFLILLPKCIFSQGSGNAERTISIQLDGSKKFQQVDGIGVNVNTRSWNNGELAPALNLLIDSMHTALWRVIVETVYNWEDENDNADPFTFNWDYYNRIYSTSKFQKAWDMIAYLNKRGIDKNLMINFMGPIPLWMGGKVVTEKYEDEYIEMLVSFFYYARRVKHLQIGLISIMNEPDIENEGPTVGAIQYKRLLRKFSDRMEGLGMGDIRFVAPDVAAMEVGIKSYLPELRKDSVIMSKIEHFGLHSYGGYYADIDSAIIHSPYPATSYWLTEWNNWCIGCDNGILGEYNYSFAAKSINYLLDFFQRGAKGAISWEGYDSYYEHHAPSQFSYWGLLAYDARTKTYTPRKNFYANQQVSNFVRPGSRRIACSSGGDSLVLVAFLDSMLQQINIVGINKTGHPISLKGLLSNLPATDKFELYYTNNTENVRKSGFAKVKGKTFSMSVPADCIFTLSSSPAKEVRLSDVLPRPEASGWYAGDIHVHLNCGFRLGLAAGTDFPCNDDEPLGTLLTYIKVKDALTYDNWIQGIKKGNTIVSRNGHNEFLEMTVNGSY